MKRQAEYILGLIGGGIFTLIGLISFILSLSYGSSVLLPRLSGMTGSMVVCAALITLLFASAGLLGAFFVKRKTTLSGVLMIVSGIMGFAISGFPVSFLWSFPLIIAGIMACVPKMERKASGPAQ